MNLQELITITNKIYYNDITYYKVIQSKQNELLSIIKPTTNIKKIDYKIIDKYITTLKNKGNKPATINAKISYLNHILNYAYQMRLIDYKPVIKQQKIIAKKDYIITEDQLEQMLAWCVHNHQQELHNILKIGYYTGLRINNILSLTSDNYKNSSLHIYDRKVNRNFILPVSDKIKDIITSHTRFNMNYQSVYYEFNKKKQELQLDDRITIHTLRHSFCSNLLEKGVPLPVVSTLANHKKITTTSRYIHTNINQLTSAIAML